MKFDAITQSSVKRKLTALIEATTPSIKRQRTSATGSVLTIPTGSTNRSTYNPWSRPQLLSRLSTFKSCYWETEQSFGVGLTPVDCAQLGWICVGFMTLKCVHCNSLLSVKLPTIEINGDNEIYHKVCARYKDDILVNHHRQGCSWRMQKHWKTGIEDDSQKNIYYDGLKITTDVINKLRERYKKFIEFSKNLPEPVKHENNELFDKIDKDLFKTRLLGTTNKSLAAVTYNDIASEYTLYGWEILTVGKAVFIQCTSCFRKVLILNQGKQVLQDQQIDLMDEHKSYCNILISWPQTLKDYFELPLVLTNSKTSSIFDCPAVNNNNNSNNDNLNINDSGNENIELANDRAERLKRIKDIFNSPLKTKSPTPARITQFPHKASFDLSTYKSKTPNDLNLALDTPTKERNQK